MPFQSGLFHIFVPMKLPKTLKSKLHQREQNNALRQLPISNPLIDFSSNDYLGFARNQTIFHATHQYLVAHDYTKNGATGSRLLTGNHKVFQEVENYLATFHQMESALIFNSGYDANIGFFSAVPQKNDVILYDELCHASIRDGIVMSHAKAYKFRHNDCAHLQKLLTNNKIETNTIYVVTESIFSMDGDSPDLTKMVAITKENDAFLVIDEAHAVGVVGKKGEGLVQHLGFQNDVFARIITFGKSMGCHGAAILGSNNLKKYLINYSRSFIYTTALSPHSVATILMAYQHLEAAHEERQALKKNIDVFAKEAARHQLNFEINSTSAIQTLVISGNTKVKELAKKVQDAGFDVKPIMAPTVPEGKERLRFCLHSYNTETEIIEVLAVLANVTTNKS